MHLHRGSSAVGASAAPSPTPRAGQGWARPGRGQVSSGGGVAVSQSSHRSTEPTGERGRAREPRAARSSRGREERGWREGRKMKGERASERARTGREGEQASAARECASGPCAPRTASRPLTSAGPRAGPPGPGGAGAGGGARAGARVTSGGARRARPPLPHSPQGPRLPEVGSRGLAGRGPGAGLAPRRPSPPPPPPRPHALAAPGLWSMGARGCGRRRGQVGPLAAAGAASLPLPFLLHLGSGSSPSWLLSCCWGRNG